MGLVGWLVWVGWCLGGATKFRRLVGWFWWFVGCGGEFWWLGRVGLFSTFWVGSLG